MMYFSFYIQIISAIINEISPADNTEMDNYFKRKLALSTTEEKYKLINT